MTLEDSPVCARHEAAVAMSLRTIHSDSSRPDQLVGKFECPECGHESWRPFLVAEVA